MDDIRKNVKQIHGTGYRFYCRLIVNPPYDLWFGFPTDNTFETAGFVFQGFDILQFLDELGCFFLFCKANGFLLERVKQNPLNIL